jgi:hypothetical protein
MNTKTRLSRWLATAGSAGIAALVLGGATLATAQDAEMSMSEMAKKSANPMSDIWMLLCQNDLSYIDGGTVPGDGGRWMNSFKFMPVMPLPIMDGDWNLIFRPVFPFLSSPYNDDLVRDPAAPLFDRTDGMGDMVLLSLIGPNTTDGLVWGAGLTQMFPTASQDILGQHKWQAGPAFIIASLGTESGGLGFENWNIGMLAQQWWSYAGNSKWGHTSQMDIQYFINWRLNETALIGMTPNISIDWTAKSGNRISVPIGLGYIDIIKIGKLPVRVGIEAQYYVVRKDSSGPEWNIRLIFSPIIANPFKK